MCNRQRRGTVVPILQHKLQEARDVPHRGPGDCALGGHGPFCRLRRRGFRTLRRAGRAAARRQGQKGVQDTCGFLYPLLRLPLIFRRPRKRCFAAKNEESTDFTSVLSFFFCHGSAIAWFAAHISARPVCTGRKMGGVEYFDVKSLLSGFLGCFRRAGHSRVASLAAMPQFTSCPHPAG